MSNKAQRIISFILIIIGIAVGFLGLYLYLAYMDNVAFLIVMSLLFISVGVLNLVVEDTTKK